MSCAPEAMTRTGLEFAINVIRSKKWQHFSTNVPPEFLLNRFQLFTCNSNHNPHAFFTVKSLKSSRLCTALYQHMINFTCVLQCTSQDKTSWTWHFKFQESYEMEGTYFHQICSVLQIPENRTYLMKTGTFHFIKFLKLKKFIMLVKEPLSRSS
jgi:hypothetical protein